MKTRGNFARLATSWLGVAVSLGASLSARADVVLAPLFQDGCVVQREMPLRIFGQADRGEAVMVSFNGAEAKTVADERGRWLVELPVQAASKIGLTLSVRGKNAVVVRDVLVGDVWLCSGQSNMEMLVRDSANAEDEIAAGAMPLIRHFKVERAVAREPATKLEGRWQTATPETVGSFSAVAYFFARHLQRALDVPIGLLHSSWGGTHIEAWLSTDALEENPYRDSVRARWEKRVADFPEAMRQYQVDRARWEEEAAAAKAAGRTFNRRAPREPEGDNSRWMPGGLFNAMIAPLVPATLRGVLWYQGEANVGRHEEYASLFPAMIEQWRRDFRDDALPFFFVQLANFASPGDPTAERWAWLREAQTKALELKGTGMAVALDIGEALDIHPKNKQEVGRRLALLALNRVHGRSCVDEGPVISSLKANGRAVEIRFAAPEKVVVRDDVVAGFEIAGEDGEFHFARAKWDGQVLTVSHPLVEQPVAVRYAWANDPPLSLFNTEGLPLPPGRWRVE